MTSGKQLPPEIAGFDPRSKVSHVALAAFNRICRDWQCTDDESLKLLGGLGLIDMIRIQGKADHLEPFTLTDEQLYRIKCLVEIYRALANTLSSLNQMRRELRRSWPGTPFIGKSPLHHMTNTGSRGIVQTTRAIVGVAPEPPTSVSERPPANRVTQTKRQERA